LTALMTANDGVSMTANWSPSGLKTGELAIALLG